MSWLNHYCVVFGYAFRAGVVLIGFFAITDLLGASQFGRQALARVRQILN
jgi:hypothetical protein